MKLLLAVLLTAATCCAQTTPLPNLYPICAQRCYVDSNTNPSAVYQYGDLPTYVFASSFVNPTFPLEVNYSNGANLGMPAVWVGNMYPTTLYVQQQTFVQTLKVHNLDPQSWTVTVPALTALTITAAVSGAVTASPPSASVTIPKQTTTAPVVPQQTASCYVPKNGGTCKIIVPAQTLAPVTIPAQTLPVDSASATYKFTCTAPMVDGNVDLANLTCTAAKQ